MSKYVLGAVLICVCLVFGFILTQSPPLQPLNSCTIQDVNGDTLKIEVANNETWNQLLAMKESGVRRWVGGKLVLANNTWGFTFDPNTIRVAEVTAEAFQTTLRLIKQDPNYWLGTICYVGAIVLRNPVPI